MGAWLAPLPPDAFVYTPGPTTQFEDLAASSLAGVGDSSDTFDADLSAFMALVAVAGAGPADVDPLITDLEGAMTLFSTDNFTPILTDLQNIGPGIDAATSTLSMLNSFGGAALDVLMPWLNSIGSGLLQALSIANLADSLATAAMTNLEAVQNQVMEIQEEQASGGAGIIPG